MRILFFFIFFLLFGAFFIISNNDLPLNESKNINTFGTFYYNWMAGIFDNFAKIGGYVIKADWVPDNNSTISR